MEPAREEAKEESPRRGAWAPGRPRAQRGEEARQQGERPQGRTSQKPQEDPGRAPQRPAAEAQPPQEQAAQEKVRAAITSIRLRFGAYAIGLGYRGIRYVRGNATARDPGGYFFLGNGR
jgi:hypothetical protein